MKEKWSYLAGLIDGEGCISVSKRINNYNNRGRSDYVQYNFRISVTNTSLKLMKWLISNFGGVYYTKREATIKHSTSYEWRPKGRGNNEQTLLGIIPYLVIKSEHAKTGLLYVRLPEQDPKSRDVLFQKLRLLNQKGPLPETNTSDDSVQPAELKIESDLTGDRESAPVVTQDA
jgi:hypothetical protein